MKYNVCAFRGFHPDENGNTTITLDGEKIRGEWIYWDKYGVLVDIEKDDTVFDYSACCFITIANIKTFGQTTGQLVTTDKNGKKVFLGDKVFDEYNQKVYVVEWSEESLSFYLNDPDTTDYEFFGVGNINSKDIVLIGNKWEK